MLTYIYNIKYVKILIFPVSEKEKNAWFICDLLFYIYFGFISIFNPIPGKKLTISRSLNLKLPLILYLFLRNQLYLFCEWKYSYISVQRSAQSPSLTYLFPVFYLYYLWSYISRGSYAIANISCICSTQYLDRLHAVNLDQIICAQHEGSRV